MNVIKNTEIASVLGISETAVRKAKKKDKEKFLQYMDAYIKKITWKEYKELLKRKEVEEMTKLISEKEIVVANVQEDFKITAVVNYKGGVGKSTISNLLKLQDSVVLNLDNQDAEAYNSSRTINYFELKEKEQISLDEVVSILKEEGIKNLILDAPGKENSQELMYLLDQVDNFIIPTTTGARSIEASIQYAEMLLSLHNNPSNTKWAFVLNKYTDEKTAINELEAIKDGVNELLLSQYDIKAYITKLKLSQAVATMEWERESIEELEFKQRIAYNSFRKRVDELNKELKDFFELV